MTRILAPQPVVLAPERVSAPALVIELRGRRMIEPVRDQAGAFVGINLCVIGFDGVALVRHPMSMAELDGLVETLQRVKRVESGAYPPPG